MFSNLNYKETLRLARLNHIDVIKLDVAIEVECIFYDVDLTEEQFEKVCILIEDAYLKSEYLSINQLTIGANALYEDYQDVDKMLENVDRYDVIDRACWC